ncbi:pentatricopeptide repeat-containing protein At1g18485-like [Typha latifolia]|uniref:pentatricopeptide repeat-containing protein At1g18485-like n=1 Tax=Typha latifolia TaxID=4733 RepID=UPI003C2D8B6B
MLHLGVKPNSLSFSAALRSAAAIPSLRLVRLLHALSIVSSLHHPPSLIAAYSKSGDFPSARKVFDAMPERARSFEARTAMISALGAHGMAEEAVGMFDDMGPEVDDKAVTAALAACAHAGMLVEARRVFRSVSGRRRTVEHYTCMVDVLGRAGRVEEAEALLTEMEAEEMDEGIWAALLAACRLHGRIDVAERIADRLYGLKAELNKCTSAS